MSLTIHVAIMEHHTNLLIKKRHFRSLFQIKSATIPTVLSTDTPTQIEPSFKSEKHKSWVNNTVMYCLQKPVTKIPSHSHLLHLLEPVLLYIASVITTLCLVYFLSRKVQSMHCFFTNFKVNDEVGTQTPGTCNKTFFLRFTGFLHINTV
jgi:hypothetical protein